MNKIISRELDNWSHKNCKHPEKKLSMCLGHYIANPNISHFDGYSQISFYNTNPKHFFCKSLKNTMHFSIKFDPPNE